MKRCYVVMFISIYTTTYLQSKLVTTSIKKKHVIKIMTSIRSRVLDYLNIHPGTSRMELKKVFGDCPKETVDRYYTTFNKTSKDIQLDIKTELTKIIKDYKQPASARVQAIREYNNLIETTPENSEDTLLKLYETLEKSS